MQDIGIVYQDEHLLAVNKPSGLLSVPGRGPDKQDCLIHRILPHYPNARIVHRLDMATSGLILIPLSHDSQVALGQQFEKRTMEKHYCALVEGSLEPQSQLIDLPLICDWPNRPLQMVDHENGKSAQTQAELLSYDGENHCSRLTLKPLTGRSHQLRVHMQAIGHPILGDEFYAPEAVQKKSPRLCLHAEFLTLKHPISGEELSMHCPADF
ncbi:pseudouridine synthase [Pseudoteredinibacter isoporae]|uniref:tRNA pseudouridine32 synthase/23S rRNA pseudouridine746 synthase n=1 Tax=Pseudoteredinibacter isoporae TaxID=570281 RepID=A0A7X0MW96_9GAMM|nr:pseudouridine synthase [Pseudoteredinibacter isoporae]MBB6521955.1 tRNA pseudouridine32 synthase/23S rRNA pseudouridine746 synthase [Pseudoteredinibacter isoporae]NHO87491.1 RNA pseudouridine synthase [Pseudoteredinibacter isoporae]NIB24178.1 RNA pseudouridine synthase [Pseudoteredinibacter isoporae]